MRNILKIAFTALAVGKKPTTWLLDGNNILGQKGTPRDAQVLVQKLQPIAESSTSDAMIIVFDGKKSNGADGSSSSSSRTEWSQGHFRHVQLEEGMTADEFILEEIQAIAAESKQNRIKLVTADKRLRSFALDTRPVVKTVVNPKIFWRKYYPRMSGLKKRVEDTEESSEIDS